MGMVVVALLAANVGPVAETTIKSTLRRTRSAASSARRSVFSSLNRDSIVKFLPSIHPSLRISCQKASKRTALLRASLGSRRPIRKIFPVCCASTEPHSAKSMAISAKTVILLFMFFPALSFDTPRSPLFSLDHLIRSRQHVGWNREPDLLRGLQVNDELKLRRLLYG